MALQANLVNVNGGAANAYLRASETAINNLKSVGDGIGQATQAIAQESERPERTQLNTLLANDDYDGAEEFINQNGNRLLNANGAIEEVKTGRELFETNKRNKLIEDDKFDDNQNERGNREARNQIIGLASSAKTQDDIAAVRKQIDDSDIIDKQSLYNTLQSQGESIDNRLIAAEDRADRKQATAFSQAATAYNQNRTRAQDARNDAFTSLNNEVNKSLVSGDYQAAQDLINSSGSERAGELLLAVQNQQKLTESTVFSNTASLQTATQQIVADSPYVQEAQAQVAQAQANVDKYKSDIDFNATKYQGSATAVINDSLKAGGYVGTEPKYIAEGTRDILEQLDNTYITYKGDTHFQASKLPADLLHIAIKNMGWDGLRPLSSLVEDTFGSERIEGTISRAEGERQAIQKNQQAAKTAYETANRNVEYAKLDTQINALQGAVNSNPNRTDSKNIVRGVADLQLKKKQMEDIDAKNSVNSLLKRAKNGTVPTEEIAETVDKVGGVQKFFQQLIKK